mgnify:CR=1 FL=1
MANINTLLKREKFFAGLQRRWKLGLFFMPLIIIGIGVIGYFYAAKSKLLYILIPTLIAIIGFELLWLMSYIILPIIRWQKTKLYNAKRKAIKEPQGKTKYSSSKMLAPNQRLKAKLNLNELKNASDYCFVGNEHSYLRIQWLKSGLIPKGYDMDMMKTWNENNIYSFEIRYNNEVIVLTVERTLKGNRENVYACWTPPNPRQPDIKLAETVELYRNEPIALTCESVCELPNGENEYFDEILCVITWIGGN